MSFATSFARYHHHRTLTLTARSDLKMSLISHLPLVNLHTSPPVLSVGFAVGACTLFTVSYVGSLYLTAAGRVTDTKDENGEVLDRDHPKVIRARIKTASLATAVTVVATGAISWVKEAVVKSVSSLPSPSYDTSICDVAVLTICMPLIL